MACQGDGRNPSEKPRTRVDSGAVDIEIEKPNGSGRAAERREPPPARAAVEDGYASFIVDYICLYKCI